LNNNHELKERRKRLGLSQSKLSNFLEIALPTYEKMEIGTRPTPKKHMHKLSMYQNLTDIDILIGIYHGERITQLYRRQFECEGI
jgi:DNA-binding XRE family transcriptional regulator